MSAASFDQPTLETRVVDSLVAPSIAARDEMLSAPITTRTHAQFYSDAACLHELELSQPMAVSNEFAHPTTVAFWNVERLKDIPNVVRLLKEASADIALLSEVDVGMAR